MSRTWKRLAGPLLITNSVVTRYTVPASTTAIVRHIHISNTSAGAATVTVSIGADAAGTRILDAISIPASGQLDLYGPYVMVAAEILQTNAGTTNVLNITINGEEITLG
mgnify:CR=1 FL=1